MLKSGILNPQINNLLSRFRHTNTIVIADRGFPFWPTMETIDISLIDNIPNVPQVLIAIRSATTIGRVWMAEEFLNNNTSATVNNFSEALGNLPVTYKPHDQFKLLVPHAIGLIRTGETVQYSNIILKSS